MGKSKHRHCKPLGGCDNCYIGPPIQSRVLAPAAYHAWPHSMVPPYTMDAAPILPSYYAPRVVGGFTQPYYDPNYAVGYPGRIYDERNPYPGGVPAAPGNPPATVNPAAFTTYDARSGGTLIP